MTEIAVLGLSIKSEEALAAAKDLDVLTAAAEKTEKATDRLAPASKKASDGIKQVGAESRSIEGSLQALASRAGVVASRLAAMAGAALSVAGYVRLADTWSDLRSQLGAAIGDMDRASLMMRRMVDIANASYSPLEQTVQTYARNVTVLRALGKTSAEAADFTEALNHALVITATKGERAASVQNALSRAMAVGKLQADGLETVLANGGKVAEVLAEHLGTNVNGLRKLASEGKITGDVIASSLISRLDDLRAIAGDMPATVGDAFTRLTTNVTQFIGEIDQATGISATMSEAIMALAGNIDMIAGFATAAAAAMTALFIPSIWGSVTAVASLVAGLVTLKGALAATGIGAFVVGAGVLIGKFFELVRATGSFSEALAAVGEVWEATKNWISAGATAMVDIFMGTTQRIGAYFTSLWASVQSGFAEMMKALQAGINKMISSLNSISVDMPDWMGGGTVGFAIPEATFADGYVKAAEASAATAKNMHAAADAAFELAATRLDNVESPVAALARLLAGNEGSDVGGGDTATPLGAPPDGGSRGGGGGGGGGLKGIVSDLATELEQLAVWREERLAAIQAATDAELELIGGRNEAKLRLELEYQARLREIQDQERAYTQSAQEGMYGALIGLMDSFGTKSKGLAMAALALNTWLRVRETLQNTAAASVRALAELGPIAGPPAAAKIMAYGKLQAGLIAASGIVSAVAGGSGGGGGGGGGGSGVSQSNVAQQAAPVAAPQDVTIDFTTLDPALKALAAAIAGPMIEQLQKASKNGVNIVGIRT